ncbi:Digestive cysteine proteinase 2-like 2 [Homarus americanus]|uniref:Digestive cysteine proteinase 2-like 2 n=2 Tax=Homarus americanus TaxID=6706 RepID=A0A8J5JAN8_HOMAM|nr:Digestive cysteine proteinase 2-like 2 [Homarus americanus]
MKALIIFLCGMTLAAATLTWDEFKTEFGKQYKDTEEVNQRRRIFEDNLKYIEDHNNKYERGEVTFTMKINKFSDMTPEEMRSMRGYRRPSEAQGAGGPGEL